MWWICDRSPKHLLYCRSVTNERDAMTSWSTMTPGSKQPPLCRNLITGCINVDNLWTTTVWKWGKHLQSVQPSYRNFNGLDSALKPICQTGFLCCQSAEGWWITKLFITYCTSAAVPGVRKTFSDSQNSVQRSFHCSAWIHLKYPDGREVW